MVGPSKKLRLTLEVTMKKRSYAPIIIVLILITSLFGIYFLLDYGIVGVEKSSDVTRIQEIKAPIKVHYLDIGQGDAIFIQINKTNLLIDAGEKEHAQTIIDYLKSYGVETLDYVFLTHPHEDHLGGMGEVISNFNLGEFYTPNKTLVTKSFIRLTDALDHKNKAMNFIKGGMSFDFGEGIVLEIFSPNRETYLNPNNYSPIMRLSHGNTAFLFTGDAEEMIEEEVLKLQVNLKSDVLKAPHHGSKTSSSLAFLEQVSPAFVVVTSEKGNTHNLPSPDILNRYRELGFQVVLTEDSGHVVFSSNGDEVTPLSN